MIYQSLQLFNTFCSKLVHDNDPVDFDLNPQCIYNIFNQDMAYPCNKTLIDEQNMQRLQRSWGVDHELNKIAPKLIWVRKQIGNS